MEGDALMPFVSFVSQGCILFNISASSFPVICSRNMLFLARRMQNTARVEALKYRLPRRVEMYLYASAPSGCNVV
jgi:hypothetical protein